MEGSDENKKRASKAALSSAALLSSMVDDDLCQYKYAQEWKEKQKALKMVPKVTSFLKRIINVLHIVPLRVAVDRKSSSTSEENTNKTLRHSIPLTPKSPSVLKKKKIRVLLVDESMVVHTLMSQWLKDHGCTVDGALNGKIGLKFMKAYQYDLCLISLVLPVTLGVDTIVEFSRYV
jgi:PleD family two-component response regulator